MTHFHVLIAESGSPKRVRRYRDREHATVGVKVAVFTALPADRPCLVTRDGTVRTPAGRLVAKVTLEGPFEGHECQECRR